MRIDESTKFKKLTPAGQLAYTTDKKNESDAAFAKGAVGVTYPNSLAKLLRGDYDNIR